MTDVQAEQPVLLSDPVAPAGAVEAPAGTDYTLDKKAKKDINNFFSYHSPKGDQVARYEELRASAKKLAVKISKLCPPCADRTAAIRKLRECIMTANAAIACNE